MKKTLWFFVLVALFCQCTSQGKEASYQPVLEKNAAKIPDQKYFIGKWYNTETYFITANNKKLQPVSKCELNSYWDFREENKVLKQSIFKAKGKDCSEFISSKYSTVIFADNSAQYFVDDVIYSVKIKIISNHKFVLTTKDFIGGRNVEIEKIYEKK